MAKILMPKATAVWLIDNTTLTFDQIADFCELHPLEVKGIANGEVAENMRGADPVASGELTREEIDRGQADANYRLKSPEPKHQSVPQPKRTGARFTPVSRRKDRPDAIAWFIKNHPEITDPQISRLIGTTKSTIESVRSRQHWNTPNIKPVDPVTLGLCSQIELDELVSRAASKRAEAKANREVRQAGPTLRKITPVEPAPETESDQPREQTAEEVFANFGKAKPEDE
ncbi:MAG: DUF1013 domain-containing protein [Alphaproteobacteria bacterium]|nr:DUF1013 domain-containing protein [Alphaproteobacteria bacterium]